MISHPCILTYISNNCNSITCFTLCSLSPLFQLHEQCKMIWVLLQVLPLLLVSKMQDFPVQLIAPFVLVVPFNKLFLCHQGTAITVIDCSSSIVIPTQLCTNITVVLYQHYIYLSSYSANPEDQIHKEQQVIMTRQKGQILCKIPCLKQIFERHKPSP